MKYSFLFLAFFILTTSHTAQQPIEEQPHKTTETLTALVGLHCLDAITDKSQEHCPVGTRVFYNCCKTSLCIGTAYSLSGETMDIFRINRTEQPFIRNCLTLGIDFGLLHLIQRTQARFEIKRKKLKRTV